MKELQEYIERYGFGISKKELATKAYWRMVAMGKDVAIMNDLYLIIDGTTYYFSKSKKYGKWIAKAV